MPEIWTQTVVTVIPRINSCFRHRDVEVQEIRAETTISADVHEPFTISKEDFTPEPPPRHLVDPEELKEQPTRDAENQTFLQGVPTVIIPIEQKHEVSQTTYMRGYPPKEYIIMMSSMNIQPPVFKSSRSSQTEIGIPPGTPQHEVAKYFSSSVHDKSRDNPPSRENPADPETIIHEILNYLLSRTLWIADPDLYQTPIETRCQETQTVIRYNRKTDSIVTDSEIQTKLTCEPRYSNSKLLAEYEETRSFVQTCLQECLKGIESRVMIDELIAEMITKGADRIKHPVCDQASQTVASYGSHGIKEKDMLRKLRIPLVVDPLEASTVVVPLMDDLLRSTCDEVSRDARRVVKDILDSSVRQSVLIGVKLAGIRKQLRPKSIEEILDRRRKKIVEAMLKRETETAATQTGLAGVPVVAKIKEDVLCSVYTRQSICEWCRAAQEEDVPLESTRLLRTQDVLLAYKPCYVVATASEEANNPHLQSTTLKTKEHEKLTIQPEICVSPSEKIGDVKTINMLMTPKKSLQDRDSISGWARIIDDTLAKSWSFKESTVSNSTNVTITSFAATAISKSCCKETSQFENVPNLQVTQALQILKKTFCTRETCSARALKRNRLLDKRKNKVPVSCNLDNCTLLNFDQCPERPIDQIDSQICARPRADKFRTVPVYKF